MSRLISRIALCIILFPGALLLDLILFLVIARHTNWDSEFCTFVSNIATAAFIDFAWFLLWRSSIGWNAHRTRATLFAIGFSSLAGGVIGWGIRHVTDQEIATVTGAWSAALIWCAATVFLWRETPAERGYRLRRAGADTLICPACGYNLTGLSEARCPECGASFALNELLAAQPSRSPAELETA